MWMEVLLLLLLLLWVFIMPNHRSAKRSQVHIHLHNGLSTWVEPSHDCLYRRRSIVSHLSFILGFIHLWVSHLFSPAVFLSLSTLWELISFRPLSTIQTFFSSPFSPPCFHHQPYLINHHPNPMYCWFSYLSSTSGPSRLAAPAVGAPLSRSFYVTLM